MREKNTLRACARCGAPFTKRQISNRNVYCSPACHDRARERWRNCDVCGRRYQPHRDGGERFCGPQCRGVARRHPKPTCERCGTEFDRTHGREQRFCSPRCAVNGRYERQREQGISPRRVVVPCVLCGRSTERFLSDLSRGGNRGRYCSKDCAYAARRGAMPKHFDAYHDGMQPTSIEAEAYAALDALGITYERQVKLGPTRVDALIPASMTVVEVQGDFWHCNPAVYPDGPQ